MVFYEMHPRGYPDVKLINIGIKHGLSCINIRQVPWEVLKTEAEGRGFQHLPRDPGNVNALKNHVSAAVFNTSQGTRGMLMH